MVTRRLAYVLPVRSDPGRTCRPRVENLEERRLLAFDQGAVLVETFDDLTLTSAQLTAPQGWDDTKSIPAPPGSGLPPTPTNQPLFHHLITSVGGRLDAELVQGEGTTTVTGLPRQALHIVAIGADPESTASARDDVTFPVLNPSTDAVRVAAVDVQRDSDGVVVTFVGANGQESVVDRLPTGTIAPPPSVIGIGGPVTPGGSSLVLDLNPPPPGPAIWDTLGATSGDLLPNGQQLGAIRSITLAAPSGREFDNLRIFVGNPVVVGPLVATDDTARTPPDHPVAIPVLLNDSEPNGGPLSIQSVTNGATVHGTFVPSSGKAVSTDGQNITYTPAPMFHGLDRISYVVADSHGHSATATVTIAVDTPPEAGDHTYILPSRDAGNVSIPAPPFLGLLHFASDAENDPLSVEPVAGELTALGGSVTIRSDGSFDYTPPAGGVPRKNTPDRFSYTVTDGLVDGTPGTIRIGRETPPPNAVDETFLVANGHAGPVSFAAPGVFANNPLSDADGDTLVPVVVTQPASGRVAFNADGSFTYTPNDLTQPDRDDSFVYALSDSFETGGQAVVHLHVLNNHLPPGGDKNIFLRHGTPGPILGSAGTPNTGGDPLFYSLIGAPANHTGTVTVDAATGAFRFDPNPVTVNDIEYGLTTVTTVRVPDSFVIRISDGIASSDVTVHLVVPNFGNFAENDYFVVPVNDGTTSQYPAIPGVDPGEPPGAVRFAVPGVLWNDFDLDNALFSHVPGQYDPLTAILVRGPDHGRLALRPDGSFTYTPDPHYRGQDGFQYKATDGAEVSNPATVTIDVAPNVPVLHDDVVDLDPTDPVNHMIVRDKLLDVLRNDGLTFPLNHVFKIVEGQRGAFVGNFQTDNPPVLMDYVTPLSGHDHRFTYEYGSSNFATVTVHVIDHDSDGDGVTDREEVGVPSYGESFPGESAMIDPGLSTVAFDPTVTRIRVAPTQWITLHSTTPGATFTNVSQVSNPHPADSPPGVSFPAGFSSYELHLPAPGAATTVEIVLPLGVTVNDYWKYGPTPDLVGHGGTHPAHWYRFLFDPLTGTGASFSTRIIPDPDPFFFPRQLPLETVTVHLVDGRRGDDDLTANGVVIDPGGPAISAARLALGQTVAPAAPLVGQDLTFTLTVGNRGPVPAPGVVVTDPLPAGVEYVSAASSQGVCVFLNGAVRCSVGTLAPGASATVRIDVRPTTPGRLTNTARVSGPLIEPVASRGVATATAPAVPAGPLQQFVTTLYSRILGRVPEPRGLAFWVGRLEAGESRRRVARDLFDSPEHHKLKYQHQAPALTLRRSFLDAQHAAEPAAR